MPAPSLHTHPTPSGGSSAFTRTAVEDVENGKVTVYFSRDTVKKLAGNASGTGACGIDATAGEARGTGE